MSLFSTQLSLTLRTKELREWSLRKYLSHSRVSVSTAAVVTSLKSIQQCIWSLLAFWGFTLICCVHRGHTSNSSVFIWDKKAKLSRVHIHASLKRIRIFRWIENSDFVCTHSVSSFSGWENGYLVPWPCGYRSFERMHQKRGRRSEYLVNTRTHGSLQLSSSPLQVCDTFESKELKETVTLALKTCGVTSKMLSLTQNQEMQRNYGRLSNHPGLEYLFTGARSWLNPCSTYMLEVLKNCSYTKY